MSKRFSSSPSWHRAFIHGHPYLVTALRSRWSLTCFGRALLCLGWIALSGMLGRLRSHIVGQDDATTAIATLFDSLTTPGPWPRPVIPVAVFGPTGTGKTTLVRAAASAAGVPLLEFDATAHSGTDLRDRVR